MDPLERAKWEESVRNDPRPTVELAKLACQGDDSEERWKAIVILHYRGTREVFETARVLCNSNLPIERCAGADILGQLGIPERSFPEESVDLLLNLLNTEQDVGVLRAIATALGHIGDQRAIAPLCRIKNHDHPEVRRGVVYGLMGHTQELAVKAMIDLSDDNDLDVRNWATFSLGTQIDLDTPEIRAALWRRVVDPDLEVRGEALVGLARRHDPNVFEPLLRELNSEEVGSLAVEAAEELGDPRLLESLEMLKGLNPDDRQIREAMEKCQRSPQQEQG